MASWASPLAGTDEGRSGRSERLLVFIVWLALVAWLCWTHVFWRDEVRALSLALSGSNYGQMLRDVHGEGHPALWYLILRGGHDLFPYREVLPVAGAVIGIAAMALVAFFSPFRLPVIALVLFSGYGAHDYVVISRNYGIAALVMLALAALYGRVRNTLWLGVILAILCNTNVPSCILAAGFLLFRFVEMLTDGSKPGRREWLVFAGNAALAAAGALLCFVTVYPTFNDAAVSSNYGQLSLAKFGAALVDSQRSFSHVFGAVLFPISCLLFVRRPAALFGSFATFLVLKLFFFFVYPASYRHEVLYLFFLLSLLWMTARGAGGTWPQNAWMRLELVGSLGLFVLLAVNSAVLLGPIRDQLAGRPYSHSADAAKLLRQPRLSGAIVMADPDTMAEPLAYYAGNPIWMLRRQAFAKVARLNRQARLHLTLDDILEDMARLHGRTGRPVVFLSHVPIHPGMNQRAFVMFGFSTEFTPASANRFLASTRQIASLREPNLSGETYDVFVYPR